MTMKKCDGTALLTNQTMNCSTVDYFCVVGYDDGDDVFVDVTSGNWPSEVSWEFYKSNGTAVTFYNENGAETDGTACQYVKSTTAACAQYDSGSGSCTSNSYSNSYSFDFGSSYDYSNSYSFDFGSSYDYSYSYNFPSSYDYSNSYSFDFGSSYDYSYSYNFPSSYDYSNSYSFANCPTNGCSGAYVKAMDSCKCISLEEFTIIVFFFFLYVFLMNRCYCY